MTGAVAVAVGLSTPFEVVASPDFVGALAPALTGFVTATPEGGFPPYSYLWTLQSGTGAAQSPTSASTRFGGGISTGTWICVVTDNAGRVANSNEVSVEISSGEA